MKKLILLVTACTIFSVSFAQKKPKIEAAEKARAANNLAEAKGIIDAAIVHEKTKGVGKTWYYRGLLYASIDTSSNPEYQKLADNALATAMESFKKADELKKGNSEYYITPPGAVIPELKSTQIGNLWGGYLNKGVENFENNNYEEAVKYFTKCQIIKPMDTTGYFYAGLAAQNSEDFKTAEKNFSKLVNDLDNHQLQSYRSLIYISGTVNKDQEKALEYVRKAKERFPNDVTFQREEINILIQMDKIEEAKAGLEKTIKAEPKPELYFTLGAMHDELKENDKAKDAYKKAIEMDGEHFGAHFNLAALYYNEAVVLIKEKNNLGITTNDRKKAKELDLKVKDKLKESLPYWEKVIEIEGKEKDALETLKYIYTQLGNNDKASEMQNRLDQL